MWNLLVKVKYLKKTTIWDAKIPRGASGDCLPYVCHLIGNGVNTYFWSDPRLRDGRLRDQIGDRGIHELGMGPDIRVGQFVGDGC